MCLLLRSCIQEFFLWLMSVLFSVMRLVRTYLSAPRLCPKNVLTQAIERDFCPTRVSNQQSQEPQGVSLVLWRHRRIPLLFFMPRSFKKRRYKKTEESLASRFLQRLHEQPDSLDSKVVRQLHNTPTTSRALLPENLRSLLPKDLVVAREAAVLSAQLSK